MKGLKLFSGLMPFVLVLVSFENIQDANVPLKMGNAPVTSIKHDIRIIARKVIWSGSRFRQKY